MYAGKIGKKKKKQNRYSLWLPHAKADGNYTSSIITKSLITKRKIIGQSTYYCLVKLVSCFQEMQSHPVTNSLKAKEEIARESTTLIMYYSRFQGELGGAAEPNGLPRPMVKPLVPSGILGPLEVCLADDSDWVAMLDWGDGASSPRPLWLWPRPRPFPRPLAHPFFDPAEFSSACQNNQCKVVTISFSHSTTVICLC